MFWRMKIVLNEVRKEERKRMNKIYGIIRKLGATSKYKGYFFVADAIQLAMDSHDKPIRITKDIYPYLARKYKTTTLNIEHNIRTVINVCWEMNRKNNLLGNKQLRVYAEKIHDQILFTRKFKQKTAD